MAAISRSRSSLLSFAPMKLFGLGQGLLEFGGIGVADVHDSLKASFIAAAVLEQLIELAQTALDALVADGGDELGTAQAPIGG
jgi:hypothetical protein